MNPDVPPIALAADALVVVAVVGLAVRDRWRLSWFFAAYLASIVVRNVLLNFWPERFYFLSFWLISQSILDLLKFGLALEIGWRTFGPFPGAGSVARKAGGLILILTAIAAVRLPLASPHFTSTQTAITSFHPRLNDGTIWIMAAILVIAKWYRVPVHPFHAGVLTSLALYLLFFTSILRVFGERDFETTRRYVNALDPIGFLLVACWWARIAWRSESDEDRIHMDTVKALQLRGAAVASGPSL